ncbi:DUF2147 domain-containing protein [Capnocytophaga sp. ARDL2]|uniref:DUF2147 domain-containing protein n=1 Tax=Capnocytophaga sp. ARDL2 TaxID=3238809 RepID=UPI0035567677
MKKVLATMVLSAIAYVGHAQNIVGRWKTIDDETGKAKSIVEITENKGVYTGKVIEILTEKKNAVCEKCTDERKGKPIKGMVVIKGIQKKGDEFTGGKILDPNSGKEYKCTIKPNGTNKINVRGYVGISALGRTQTWHKVN